MAATISTDFTLSSVGLAAIPPTLVVSVKSILERSQDVSAMGFEKMKFFNVGIYLKLTYKINILFSHSFGCKSLSTIQGNLIQ